MKELEIIPIEYGKSVLSEREIFQGGAEDKFRPIVYIQRDEYESGKGYFAEGMNIKLFKALVSKMQRIKSFLQPYHPVKIELLPYHKLGTHS